MSHQGSEDTLWLLLDRSPVLKCLLAGPRTKPELVEGSDRSRSTVDRAVADLVESGVVERRDSRYELTVFGRVVVGVYEDVTHRLDSLLEMREFLAALSNDVEIDPVAFDGAEVEFLSAFPSVLAEQLLADAREARILAPSLPLTCGIVTGSEPWAADRRLDLVVEEDLLARLEAHYPDDLAVLVESDAVSLSVVAGDLPFTLGVLSNDREEWLLLTAPADRDTLGVVTNRRPAAVEWGTRAIEELQDALAVDPGAPGRASSADPPDARERAER